MFSSKKDISSFVISLSISTLCLKDVSHFHPEQRTHEPLVYHRSKNVLFCKLRNAGGVEDVSSQAVLTL